MAVPTILETYPADNDTGIPIGISITVDFDKGVDLDSVKNAIVLYGGDRDHFSGPDTISWTNYSTESSPYFLRSPTFKGLVETNVILKYYDLITGDLVDDPEVITSEADEVTEGYGHRAIITPRESLAPDTEYKLQILGGARGVSSRTVFDVVADPGNSGSTGVMIASGSYTRGTADTVVVEFTTGGDIGAAKYRWYFENAGVGSAKYGLVTSRRIRSLSDGLGIRFNGSGFVSGDIYRFNVQAAEYLVAPTKLTFTTNDGSYAEPPESPSTPASSVAPLEVLPEAPGSGGHMDTRLFAVEMTPDHMSYNVNVANRTIEIVFSDDIDPATITDQSVKLYAQSVSGYYQDTYPRREIKKTLTVVDNILVIRY